MTGNAEELERLMSFVQTINYGPESIVEFGVTGSREFNDLSTISFALGAVALFHHNAIMHNGGARGADLKAAEVWSHYGSNVRMHPPRVDIYGSPKAFHVRNQEIIDRADFLLAFKRGETNGTLSTIKKAEEQDIPVFIFNQEP